MRSALALCLLLGCEKAGTPPNVDPPILVQEPAPAPKPTNDGVAQKLFAADVPTDTLPLSIAIETIGGISTILIPRGTKLPTSLTETFSTAADNQASVEVHVVQGERPLVTHNRTLGRFQLTGIPPAARGVPQIQVTFAIDGAGVLTVSARDLATAASRQIRIDGAITGPLDKATVDKVLGETEAARAEDARHGAWSTARVQLDTLIYSTRKLLADTGTKLAASSRRNVDQALTRAEAVYAASTAPGDPALVITAKQTLEKAVFEITEELYRNAK